MIVSCRAYADCCTAHRKQKDEVEFRLQQLTQLCTQNLHVRKKVKNTAKVSERVVIRYLLLLSSPALSCKRMHVVGTIWPYLQHTNFCIRSGTLRQRIPLAVYGTLVSEL